MIDLQLKSKKEAELLQRKRALVRDFVLGVVGIVSFLLLWNAAAYFQWIDDRLIASPAEVISTLFTKLTDKKPEGSVLFAHIGASLEVAFSGYLLAIGIGVPLGLLMGWYKAIDKLVGPAFELIRPVPPIAWIPLVIIFLGIGLEAKAVIVFLSAFIPALINSYTGIKLTNPVYINVSKTCGASSWTTFLRVGVPSAMPMVFAGMRISLGNAWSTLVAAEMLAANKGLGYMILMGRTYGRVDLIIGGMLMIGMLGILFNFLFDKLEARVLRWRAK